uniref:Ubiquitin-like domain-containing protein n=1 Tax=Strix occidentalis caurina TaxID=311401 RepID=A0A8D0F088_STROC
ALIRVTLDTSVWELKAKLNAQDSSLVPEMGRLIYCGRQLEDEQTLRYYKIEPESCLHHVERLRGGGEDLKLPGKVMPWSSLTAWCCGAGGAARW